MLKVITPLHWKDYELIDSGNFQKIERFGKYYLIRPEPQALWNPSSSYTDWEKQANAIFRIEKNDPEKGKWILKKGMPEQWWINYRHGGLDIRLRLGLTSFRHIGVFPEQADNWDFIFNTLKNSNTENKRVLNLFAYTGGASLAAASAGADTFHVDSVKPVISWARENMEGCNLSGIRWIVEDALKFTRREVRRGSRYQGIILDPPAYGRGADGEKWILEENLNEMISLCSELLQDKDSFLILNMYSMGFSAMVADNLVQSYFSRVKEKEAGEICLTDSYEKKLPLGTFVRFSR